MNIPFMEALVQWQTGITAALAALTVSQIAMILAVVSLRRRVKALENQPVPHQIKLKPGW